MLLGFKKQFEQYVREGSKTHTIRRVKRYPPKVGDVCHCYGDVRQTSMHLLGRWPCVAIDDVVIRPVMKRRFRSELRDVAGLKVFINGEELTPDECDALFFRDGFRNPPKGRTSADIARIFWKDNFKGGQPFVGQMIHWDFARPVTK